MVSCCDRQGLHTHAAILCQLLQPVDYELAFSILKNNARCVGGGGGSKPWTIIIVRPFDQNLYTSITPHWKVLRG